MSYQHGVPDNSVSYPPPPYAAFPYTSPYLPATRTILYPPPPYIVPAVTKPYPQQQQITHNPPHIITHNLPHYMPSPQSPPPNSCPISVPNHSPLSLPNPSTLSMHNPSSVNIPGPGQVCVPNSAFVKHNPATMIAQQQPVMSAHSPSSVPIALCTPPPPPNMMPPLVIPAYRSAIIPMPRQAYSLPMMYQASGSSQAVPHTISLPVAAYGPPPNVTYQPPVSNMPMRTTFMPPGSYMHQYMQ